jgi:hypothetical protein
MKLRLTLAAALACAAFAVPYLFVLKEEPGSPFTFSLTRRADATNPLAPGENLRRAPVSAKTAQVARRGVARYSVLSKRWKRSHRFRFPDGTAVEFSDRPRRRGETASRKRVVAYSGSAHAGAEPEETFQAATARLKLTPAAATALRFVSQHEGGFDAINTWDRARFSWGFIQFAGGRGLPPMLAYFKSQRPELFHELLGQYGVDVLPGRDGEPKPVCVLPGRKTPLYGDRAEQAIGSDPLLIGLFIRAGRHPEVQQVQIEAACEQYVRPALAARSRSLGVQLSTVLRSTKGLAMLIDRKIHSGNVKLLARAVARARHHSGGLSAAEAPALRQAIFESVRGGNWMVVRRLRSIFHSDLEGPV